MLITRLRNADRVKVACLAQLINVIAPITTNANGMFRQTIYYPYSWALQFARGSVLNLLVESPTYEVSGMGPVPDLALPGTMHPCTRKISIFLLNRHFSTTHPRLINCS